MDTPTTLYEFYTGLGLSLPPISTRADLYESYGLGDASEYTGTASQNNALLSALVQTSAPPNPALDDALATIAPYADALKSITVSDVFQVLDEVAVEDLLAILQDAGVSYENYQDGLSIVGSFSPETSLYDVFYQLISSDLPPPSDDKQPSSLYGFDTPQDVAWVPTQDGGLTGAYLSPEYSFDASSGSWAVILPSDRDLSSVPSEKLKYYTGKGFDYLKDVVEEVAVDQIFDHVLEPKLPAPVFGLLKEGYDTYGDYTSLRDIFHDYYSDIFNVVRNGMDAVSSNDKTEFSFDSVSERTGQFVDDLKIFAIKKVGSTLAGLWDSSVGSTRVWMQHSNLAFGIGDASKGDFVGQDGHSYSVIGAAGGDYLYGASGNDFLQGLDRSDHISGGGGNDLLLPGAGNDTLDGGAGLDFAVFGGSRAEYTLTKTLSGMTVASVSEGIDALINIERLHFADKSIALDTSGNGGQAYRLYQAAFDRTPDSAGLGYWIKTLDNGTTLQSVANAFILSPEFKAMYGDNPTNAELVSKFYQHVLHRAPDKGGYDYWVGILDSNFDTPDGVLANISESVENQAGVIGVIQNGIEYTPYV